ncbi:CRISPR-associated endonuclease Cas2 [Salarchaeum sp. III]|uniref:CRISPR-associated endonuclease Cas2 n=1 Tax=Salarchaeum sp. III TaxID=3107927 RepID=UPI002ED94D58
MPYAIIVYDVQADRTQKFLHYLHRYLVHVQNSVFEGELTDGQLVEIEDTLQEMLEPDESVMIYRTAGESYLDRSVYGNDPLDDQHFL